MTRFLHYNLVPVQERRGVRRTRKLARTPQVISGSAAKINTLWQHAVLVDRFDRATPTHFTSTTPETPGRDCEPMELDLHPTYCSDVFLRCLISHTEKHPHSHLGDLEDAFKPKRFTTIHPHIHTPTAESTTQGDSQLVRSIHGEASRSGPPRRSARRSRGSN